MPSGALEPVGDIDSVYRRAVDIVYAGRKAHDDNFDTPVAVFDLDDTLVRGDSFGQFTRRLLFRQRWRAAVALMLVPLLAPMLFLSPTRRIASTAFLWLASAGLSEAQFTALAEQFAATHVQKRITVAFDRLQQHLADSDRVIIVTACADPLATAICTELGRSQVEVVAARLRAGRTGRWPVLGCQGPQKVQRLRAAGVALPVDYAYTDSLSDLPLPRATKHRYLIEPSRQHLTRLQAALPDAVTVLRTTTEKRRPVRRPPRHATGPAPVERSMPPSGRKQVPHRLSRIRQGVPSRRQLRAVRGGRRRAGTGAHSTRAFNGSTRAGGGVPAAAGGRTAVQG